jgi:hypothetical protein
MSAAATLRRESEEGLSELDQRIATAFVYARFHGLFSGITKSTSPSGQVSLLVWGGTSDDEPLFKLGRWNGRYFAVDPATEETLGDESLEDLLEKIRAKYPPSCPH